MINRYLAYGAESVFGTAVPAVDFLDPESSDLDPPADTVMIYPGASGYDRIAKAGKYMPAGGFSIPFDLLAAPYWLRQGFGEVASTGTADAVYASTLAGALNVKGVDDIEVASTVNAAVDQVIQIGTGDTAETVAIQAVTDATHLALKSPLKFDHAAAEDVDSVIAPFTHLFIARRIQTLPSSTVRVGKDLFEHIITGACVDSLELTADDEFVTLDVSLVGQKDSRGALAAAVAFTDGDVYAPYEMGMTINAVDRTAIVRAATATIENNADGELGITWGSRFPRRVYQGAFMAQFEVELAFIDTDDLDTFWGAAGGPVDTGDVEIFDVQIAIGPDVTLAMPRAVWTAMQQPLAGRDPVQQTGTIRALFDEAAQTILTASVTNDRAVY